MAGMDIAEKYRARFLDNEVFCGVTREAVDQLPTIDITPFVENGSVEAKRQVAEKLRDACLNIGFFYLTGHGIPPEEMDASLRHAADLFALPEREKQKLHTLHNEGFNGWLPSDQENFYGVPDSKPDAKETMVFSREIEPGDPTADAPNVGANVYPPATILPDFEAFTKKLMAHYQRVAETLLRPFALSLGLDEEYFGPLHTFPIGVTRMHYYPSVTEEDIASQRWSCGPHTDYLGITLLQQDDVGGLEVYNCAGEWIPAPPIPGTLVVNVGDLMARWTNDLYTSTPHRVRNISGSTRYSIAYFFSPGRTMIECLDVCQSEDNPARYPPVDAIDYAVSALMETYSDELMSEQYVGRTAAATT